MFGRHFLYTFSTSGLAALYGMREADASFTEATKGLLGLKLPDEFLEGDMKKFHSSLRKPLLPTYVRYINEAVSTVVARLPESGEFEIFALMKLIVHRVRIFGRVMIPGH